MARQKNWSYNSYDEDEDISIIGNYVWDSNTLAWIKQTPAASGGGGPVSIADGDDVAQGSTADAAWVSGSGTVISLLKAIASASGGGGGGGLTDAQLRATPVPVSGPLTDTQLRATPVPVSVGTVPVTGTFWQATQPVSAASLPLPTGASTEATLATRLTESDFDAKTGALTETAPATDVASSGLNGRLQRIAQRLTSLIGLLPASLVGGRLDVNIGASGATVPVSGTFFQATQPVSIAATVAVSGPLTDAQLRATAVPVSGPLTDTQLRAAAVPVSGPLTDTQLRASSVPISVSNIDGEGSIATNQVSVTTTAGTVVAARAGRRSLLIVNHGTTDVYLGPATVTTANGLLLPGVKGASVSIPTTALVQGIVATGSVTVSFIEVF